MISTVIKHETRQNFLVPAPFYWLDHYLEKSVKLNIYFLLELDQSESRKSITKRYSECFRFQTANFEREDIVSFVFSDRKWLKTSWRMIDLRVSIRRFSIIFRLSIESSRLKATNLFAWIWEESIYWKSSYGPCLVKSDWCFDLMKRLPLIWIKSVVAGRHQFLHRP